MEKTFNDIQFKERDILGEGAYAQVYKYRTRSGINDKYVVKKIKVEYLRSFYGDQADIEIKRLFNNELRALIALSKEGVAPKIYGYHRALEENLLFYVIEKLDYTLGHMFRNKLFKPEYTKSFVELLENMIKTPYRHTDLHIENVMFDKSKNAFLLIDFGHHKKLTKKNAKDIYYTIIDETENYLVFDITRNYNNAVIGTSGASAIFYIYKFLVDNVVKGNDAAFANLKLFKAFLERNSSKKNYKKIVSILNKAIGLEH